jgi:Uncharacterized conserved protein
MRDTLFTIGYQGATVERLVETLTAAEVSILIDTRETPMSRRPEFRRRALEASLLDAGIRYVSIPALGAPKALRAQVGDWDVFAEGYRERLGLVRKELERILPLVTAERACLLCFEADPAACHRSLLAHEIQGLLDVDAVHLRPGRIDQADDDKGLRVSSHRAHDQVEVPAG